MSNKDKDTGLIWQNNGEAIYRARNWLYPVVFHEIGPSKAQPTGWRGQPKQINEEG